MWKQGNRVSTNFIYKFVHPRFYSIQKFDFNELEKSTEYEGGFTEKSSTIVDFWEIVHALPMESKKKLLEFTTGIVIIVIINKLVLTLCLCI